MRVKLKDIFDLQMGKTPSRSNLEYWNTTDYKWISIADLTKTSKYIFETKEYLSKSAIKDSGIKVIPANTVVMSFKLSIGKTAITKEDMYSNEAIMAFKDKHVINIIPEYIFYLFKYKNWEECSNKAVMGKTLNKATLSEIEVEICSIEKQRQIVNILDKIMSAVDGRKQELQLLDELIKARFVEMFGDHATNPYNWDKINISEVVGDKVSNGFFAKRDDYADDGNVSVMGVAYIVNRMYSQWQDLPRTNGTDKDIEKFEVKYGDMLFCRSSLVAEGIGKASIVPEDVPQNTLFECHVIRLPLDLSKCVPEYMQVFSTMEYFRRQIIAQSKTATMTTIGQDGILKADILLPPMSKQREFYAFVHQVNKSKFDTMTFAPIYDIINLYLHTYFYQGRR